MECSLGIITLSGISLVVELQFSKLLAGVRFAYPAQMKKMT